MIDDLSAQFHHALVKVRIEHKERLEEMLLAAARAGCGVKQSSRWVTTPEGYHIEFEFTLDPALPPYAVREAPGIITQYALREEGDDT